MGRRANPARQVFNSGSRVEHHMPRLLITASVLVSVLRNVAGTLGTFLGPSWDGAPRRYRPEDHYMRGPGPKWREKHMLDRVAAGSSQVRAARGVLRSQAERIVG
jgi:hypothetical protein